MSKSIIEHSINNATIMSVFIYLAILGLIVKAFLIWINIRHIRKNQSSVPKRFEDFITLNEHKQSADYTITRLKFKSFSIFFHFFLLMLWLPLGFLSKLDITSQSFNLSTKETGMVFFLLYLIISLIINLPESIYSTFVIEEKFGFNKTTPQIFIKDLFKQFILSIFLMTPILYGVLTFIEEFQSNWWIIAWFFIISFQFALIWAYPKFISPLFNKFTPLNDEKLSIEIDKLSQSAKLKFKDYFVMNASIRSSHGNAYFTGFGKNKRIVFFDTLLKTLSTQEIIAVLAHELGHLKKKHILKSMILSTFSMGIGFFILSKLYHFDIIFQAFKLQHSSYIALILFTHLIPLITFFFTPISSWLSRKNEYEADQFSVLHSDGESLISALIKMYKDNSNSLTPSPIFTKFYNSHPPAIERVKFIESQLELVKNK